MSSGAIGASRTRGCYFSTRETMEYIILSKDQAMEIMAEVDAKVEAARCKGYNEGRAAEAEMNATSYEEVEYAYNEGYAHGNAKGYDEGYTDGCTDGLADGYDDGYEDGH